MMMLYFVVQFSARQEHVQNLRLTHVTLRLEFVSADPMQPVVVMNFGDVKTILVRMQYQKITVILQPAR